MSVDVTAPPTRVWRALCDPAEVVQWDSGVEAALDAPPDYPASGQHVRWSYADGPFRILHDRPREVAPERKLRSLLSVGPFHFDETYSLEAVGDGCHLSAEMVVRAPLPLLGWTIEHLYLGPRTRRAVAASLRAIKSHCEEHPGSAGLQPAPTLRRAP